MPRSKFKSLSSVFRNSVSKSSSSSSTAASSLDITVVKFPKKSPDNNISSATNREVKSSADAQSVSKVPCLLTLPNEEMPLQRKEMTRERKQKWVYKNTQHPHFHRLVRTCAEKLGTEAVIEVFGKLQRETGVKEYSALLRICIEEARTSDEETSLEKIYKAFQLFKAMKEKGFQIEEETYGPFCMYLIDMGMIEEFHSLRQVITDGNSSSLSRLGYYEMLLWIKVNNEEKIEELCNCNAVDDGTDKSNLIENYLLAVSESGRKEEFLKMIELVDITKFSSVDHVGCIFKYLGRLSLESFMKKFVLELKACDCGAKHVSEFIFGYASNMHNLVVEDVILKFKDLHVKLDVKPSSTSYEKLVMYCCDSLKVHAALDIVDQMWEAGLTITLKAIHSILHASEENFDFNLVHRIYSVICCQNLEPKPETFRRMINLHVKMKDYKGAYDLLKDMQKMPTTSICNVIMAGYFREKNIYGGLMVLKQMEQADVKPDSQTFSYLIGNCKRVEDIMKHYEELKRAGVPVTKHVFMALINAYANCGQFVKAKQVVLDKEVPIKNMNEIKSVLVSALASHGQMSDAFEMFKEMKNAGFSTEPKAIISLIECCQNEGELSRLLQLLEELKDSDYYVDGCNRVLLYCVRYDHLSSAIYLLKQLKDKFHANEWAMEPTLHQVFCFIAETQPVNLKIGLDLLLAMKGELGLMPSRRSLDFLLSACVSAKDLQNSRLIWKEYQIAGFSYNVLSFLRIYQAFLACGDHKSAAKILHKIPKDDPDVSSVIQAYQRTYPKSSVKEEKKEKKKTERRLEN